VVAFVVVAIDAVAKHRLAVAVDVATAIASFVTNAGLAVGRASYRRRGWFGW
jgi:hypothetical protein